MALLPIIQDPSQTLMLIQTRWASLLNPLLKRTIVNGVQLSNVTLNGTLMIPHKLARLPLGWFLTDINAPVSVYRSAAYDTKNLTLTSSGNVNENEII